MAKFASLALGVLGGGAVPNPIVPTSGTQAITGALTVSSTLAVTGAATAAALYVNGGSAPTSTLYGIGEDGSNLILNAPSSKGFYFSVNGGGGFKINSNGNILFQTAGNGIFASNTNRAIQDNSGWTIQTPGSTDTHLFKINSATVATVAAARLTLGTAVGLTCFGVAAGSTAAKHAAYQALVTDSIIPCDANAASGSFAVTLPAAAAAAGQLLSVKVITTHATNVVTVVPAGSDKINGVSNQQSVTTFTTTSLLASAIFQSDGVATWNLVGSNGTVT